MGIVFEDGSGIPTANSYATEDILSTYTNDRDIALANGDAEAALIRATVAIDALYRPRFPGQRLKGRAQGLEWPRKCATDASGDQIADDEIPQEIIYATCEAAIRELAAPGSLMPDLERGGAIKSIKAGSVEIDYADGAEATTTFTTIDGILSGLIGTKPGRTQVAFIRRA